MNAKYVVALLLALQVSLSLCDVPVPEPSPELLQKYEELKATIRNRIHEGMNMVRNKAQPVVGAVIQTSNQDVTQMKETVEQSVGQFAEVEQITKTYKKVQEEIDILLEKGRKVLLGLYEEYLRPKIGEDLSLAIDRIRNLVHIIDPPEQEHE